MSLPRPIQAYHLYVFFSDQAMLYPIWRWNVSSEANPMLSWGCVQSEELIAITWKQPNDPALLAKNFPDSWTIFVRMIVTEAPIGGYFLLNVLHCICALPHMLWTPAYHRYPPWPTKNNKSWLSARGNLHASTAPLSMRYTTMRYTSMRHTSMALYFYEEFTQAPDKNF